MDRGLRFTSAFSTSLVEFLGTKLQMSTATYPETDWQSERVNRVLEDVLRSYTTSITSWSSFLPLAEFVLNNAVHASTDLTSFFGNSARHSRVPTYLAVMCPTSHCVSTIGEDEGDKHRSNAAHCSLSANVVTRAKAKASVLTPSGVASLLAQWTAQTLIDPSLSTRSPTANYAPIESRDQLTTWLCQSCQSLYSNVKSSSDLCVMHFSLQ